MSRHGLHHVTAVAGPASRNVAFYTRTLGLRLVKRTVNFDDPGTWHLYYGDEAGTPGTILTFFPWERAAPGRAGVGETGETVFRVPASSIGWWTHRLLERCVATAPLARRFDETVLSFRDPDGMRLALVAVPGAENEPGWTAGDVPAEHAIRGFHSVSLLLREAAPTGAVLADLGFREIGRDGSTTRFAAESTGAGGIVDIRAVGDLPRARPGGGSVHHVAFRAADDAEQAAMVARLAGNHGIAATEQRDRNYFRSVYFREPGGVLFEIATDVPGFAADEPADRLGTSLKLPLFLEERRAAIEAVLPSLESDRAASAA